MTITQLFKDKKIKIILRSSNSNTYNSIEYFDETFLLATQKTAYRRTQVLVNPADITSQLKIKVEYIDIKSLIRLDDVVCIEEIIPKLKAQAQTSQSSPPAVSDNL